MIWCFLKEDHEITIKAAKKLKVDFRPFQWFCLPFGNLIHWLFSLLCLVATASELKSRDKHLFFHSWYLKRSDSISFCKAEWCPVTATWERSCEEINAFNTLGFCSICLESFSWGLAAQQGSCSWLQFAMLTYSALPYPKTEWQVFFLQCSLKDQWKKVTHTLPHCFSGYFLLHLM